MNAHLPPLKTMDEGKLTAAVVSLDPSNEAIETATELALFAHAGVYRSTMRKGSDCKDSYVMHPMRVSLRLHLIDAGLTDQERSDLTVSALLHDVIEDAPERVQMFFGTEASANDIIGNYFGGIVLRTVESVTNPEFSPTMTRAEKHESYRQHVLRTVVRDKLSYLVKYGDLVDNAGSLKYITDDKGGRTSKARMAGKYLPVLCDMIDHVDIVDSVTGCNHISDRLESIYRELVEMV